MKPEPTQTISIDVLIVGGGAAGLRAAIEAKKHTANVVLVSESPVGFRNNTAISGAGFAASGIWKGFGDSSLVHFRDTVTGGRFINDQKLVKIMTSGAAQQFHDLVELGVKFEKQDGNLLVDHWVGHTYPRHVIIEGRGLSLTKPLRSYAANVGIQFREGVLITKLLKADDMVVGAIGIDNNERTFVLQAKSTILATGGAGQVYLRTSNAVGSTGDGYALAYEIGASLRDMEFVQFYPTALGQYGRRHWTYEDFVNKGATIRNSLGEDVLQKYGIRDFKLMTRDKVARAIMIEIAESKGIGNSLSVDLTGIPGEAFQKLREFMRSKHYPEKIWVAPTALSFMGGLKINENCETELYGLYAAGEVCGGTHGANRLAGNAITETLVFGTIAGAKAAVRASRMKHIPALGNQVTTEMERLGELASRQGRQNLQELQQSLKQTMWHNVGVLRDRKSLEDALQEILTLREQLRTVALADCYQLSQAIKLANMLTGAEMVSRSALARTESRGAHYRTDYPEQDDEQWLKTIEISRHVGQMTLRCIPANGDKQ